MMKPIKPSPMKSPAANQAQLHIGPGMRLEGKIEACDALVVEGIVDASVECHLLSILRSGTMQGNVTVETAEIDGNFEGTLVVRSCLKILTTGRVRGTITCGSLEVSRGGVLEGTIQTLDQSATGSESVLRAGGIVGSALGSVSREREAVPLSGSGGESDGRF